MQAARAPEHSGKDEELHEMAKTKCSGYITACRD